MQNDFRALCAELHTAFNTYAVDECHHALLERARIALAEPEPEEPRPTDEELLELLPLSSGEDVLYQPGSLPSDWGDTDEYIASPKALSVFARAVLARWGNHRGILDSSQQPIPVSERLPGPEDCDAVGSCWAWRSFDPENDDLGDFWQRIPREWPGGFIRWTHWLPFNALPLPSGEVE